MNEYKYSQDNFISKGDIFYEIKTRKSLLRLFGEKSSDIKEFLHSSGIKVRKADKSQLLHVVKFYDSLVASK
jgi:hypothetical protein